MLRTAVLRTAMVRAAVRATAIRLGRRDIAGVVVRALSSTALPDALSTSTVVVRREAHAMPELGRGIGVATLGGTTDSGASARLDQNSAEVALATNDGRKQVPDFLSRASRDLDLDVARRQSGERAFRIL